MRLKHIPVLGPHGFFRMAYREWGDEANPRVLVCVHGLTRNSRDYLAVAERLSPHWRVVAPDMPGRGESDRLPVKEDYAMPAYLAGCAALIARLGVERVDWLGTSMGGMIGMALAAQPNTPIARMILDDIGPVIPVAGLQRIATYVGGDPLFPSIEAVEAAMRPSAAGFGARTPDQLRRHVDASIRPDPEGGFRFDYDPAIGQLFIASLPKEDIVTWPFWDRIACPVLIIRGAESDILREADAAEMLTRGPKAELVTIPDCGHAPRLEDEFQLGAVEEWLERGATA